MIKKLLIPLLFLISITIQSQTLNWKTNINEGIEASNKEKKPMLLFFTNSVDDNLETQIFKTVDFAVWSRDNVILVKLDLSQNDNPDINIEENSKLKGAFGIQELPQVCFASASTRKTKTTFQLLGKIGYKSGGVKSWISESNALLNPSE